MRVRNAELEIANRLCLSPATLAKGPCSLEISGTNGVPISQTESEMSRIGGLTPSESASAFASRRSWMPMLNSSSL